MNSGAQIVVKLFVATFFLGLPVFSQEKPTDCQKADRILVRKKQRTLELFCGSRAFKTYKVALGTEPVGRKEKEGDHKTPEGEYRIQSKNRNSQFHWALLISYPNGQDLSRAKKMSVRPGSSIEIHVLPDEFAWVGANHRLKDWTDGCIAVTNSEIEEIWKLVPVGTPVEIRAQ